VFTDATAAAGIDFVHFNGMTGDMLFPEIMGTGVALLDYDRDGDLDLFLVQSSLLNPEKKLADALFPPTDTTRPPTDRLYRNEWVPSGRLRFTDVTATSGVAAGVGYGQGVAAGDFDGDGFPDLYIARLGENRLLRNRGDGTFAAVTEGLPPVPGWSIGAAAVDYDGDGWLDLYVLNYVEYSVAQDVRCFAPSSRVDYCGPKAYPSARDALLRNRGDGTFEDVSARTGIGGQPGAGLGVIALDADGDGGLDLYVANDGEPNRLWFHRGGGKLEEDALFSGLAVNRAGNAEASMGVTVGDIDGDGDEDLFLAHLKGETNTLYCNTGEGLFEDRTTQTGLAAPSLPYTAFGIAFLDYDNDGWLDVLVANGAEKVLEARARAGDPYPLDEPNQLFRNEGAGKFVEVPSAEAGAAVAAEAVSRGLAIGDLDNDGDPDAIIANNSGPAQLLQNEVGQNQGWIGIHATDAQGRTILGAEVEVLLASARPASPASADNPAPRTAPAEPSRRVRRSRTDGSYASSGDPRLLFGLGPYQGVVDVVVRWPVGTGDPQGSREERFPGLASRRYHTLRQGSGQTPQPPASKTSDDDHQPTTREPDQGDG